ncbi:hypothetical protein [Actinophytocola sp.]|uniref:hypothetical protein n=1 Tax=Actinophytocola sp. TaxID=1872138 RepID=UPI003D6A9CB1
MTSQVILRTGARLRSQVCSTEVIVVRPPSRTGSTLTCGGTPLVNIDAPPPPADAAPASGFAAGNALGKRYTSPTDEALEILVTKAGSGTLADGDTPLVVKPSKALPSSD